jgi:hypothetical protein
MGIYYSIQAKSKWLEVQQFGYLVGDKQYIDEDWLDAYRWLMNQMILKLAHYKGEYPMWLWKGKPDLDREGHQMPGTECVCLTLALDEKDVLFSNFDAWHCVLNNWFCSLTEVENVLFDEGMLDLSKEGSWQRIFDLDLLRQSEMWNNAEQVLQGTTGKIDLSTVLRVEAFIAK